MSNKNLKPIKLAVHGVDSRSLKTMMLFLHGPCEGAAIVVNQANDGEVDVFDADSSNSLKLLEKHLQDTALTKPVIVMSLKDYMHDGILHLVKPIKKNEMLRVLEQSKMLAAKILKDSTDCVSHLTAATDVTDEFDLLNNELFDYISTTSWDDPPVPQSSPQILRQVLAPVKPGPEAVATEQEKTPETQVRSDVAPTQANRLTDQDEQAITSYSQHETPIQGDLELEHETSDNTDENPEETEERTLKTFVSDFERKKTSKHQTAMRLDEKGFNGYIGEVEGIDVNDPTQFNNASYDPNEYFQGKFQSALMISREKNQPLLIRSNWCPIVLIPDTKEVWLKALDSEINTFAEIKLKHKTMEIKVSIAPVDPEKLNLKAALDNYQNMDAFLWKLAIWTSKGRYPRAIDYQLPVYLKEWPNFTRLFITPHAIRIAALLIKGPRTMQNVAEMLDIKPKYVFVFISAAYAVGLAGQAKRVSDSLVQSEGIKPNKGQGLFGRILNRLRK